MKTVVATKIRSIAGIVSKIAMMAVMAVLYTGFIRWGAYMTVCAWLCAISVQPVPNCSYARNRALNHPVHLRKFALFPGGAGQRLITRERPICSRRAFPGSPGKGSP